MTWDTKFLLSAKLIAQWSKHPTTKVGCVIADSLHSQLSSGYNGLPRGCDDSKILDQTRKISTTVHAEANAVAASARNGHCLRGSICYVTRPVCAQCAALLVQSGVHRVISLVDEAQFAFKGEIYFEMMVDAHVKELLQRSTGKWFDSCYEAYLLFKEVELKYHLAYLHPETRIIL